LPVPLETTHLVLVQHTPLSIRFRFDEKRFDVDGAYDIRYEIVKKRIDKAVVAGTTERLTQPGKIAIVYSQPGEAQEYRSYIEYLQSLGYLTEPSSNASSRSCRGSRASRPSASRSTSTTRSSRAPQAGRPANGSRRVRLGRVWTWFGPLRATDAVVSPRPRHRRAVPGVRWRLRRAPRRRASRGEIWMEATR